MKFSGKTRIKLFVSLTLILTLLSIATARAEDGYRLWLRYDMLSEKAPFPIARLLNR